MAESNIKVYLDNPKVLQALEDIGQAFLSLAAALARPEDEVEETKGKPPRSSKAAPKPAENEDQEDDQEDDEPVEKTVSLAHLQKTAKDLIRKGGRSDLLEILERHGLETVSSAPTKLWKALMKDLEAVQ